MEVQLPNLLLEALPEESRFRLTRLLEPVALPVGHVLFQPNESPRHVHFITSGMASIVTYLKEGELIEVGLVGHEGIAEGLQLLGPENGVKQCFMQIGGTGLRMSFRRFEEEFQRDLHLHRLVLRYVQFDALVLAQIAACNRLHNVEERLARWLLMVQDRTEAERIDLTQEFLAQMIGTRRSSVTLAAGGLQRAGTIEYRRGSVRIENRELLEEIACECYPVVRQLHRKLYQ